MSDHETHGQNAAPESPENSPGATPNVTRRKLAKAALSAPVIMTLAPRRVLGADCAPGVISIINSLGLRDEGAVFAGVSYSGRADDIAQCQECWNNTNLAQCETSVSQGNLPSGTQPHVQLRDYCEGTSGYETIDEACPLESESDQGRQSAPGHQSAPGQEPETNMSRRDFYDTLRGKKK